MALKVRALETVEVPLGTGSLTKDKVYEVLGDADVANGDNFTCYQIIDDGGNRSWWFKSRFEPLTEVYLDD